MADASLKSLFKSGGVSLGGTSMIISSEDDIDIDGQRHIRCGFVEPSIGGLDPSVINDGAYFENVGNPITIGDRILNTAPFGVSDDEQHIGYHHLDGGNSMVFSHDGGLTWANVAILTSGYSIEGVATNGTGRWLVTGFDSNVDSEVKSSIDNGLTWQTVTLPSTIAEARSQGCWYSKETGDWLIAYESNLSSGTNGAIYYNTTNVTGAWSKAPNSTATGIASTSLAMKVLPPRDGNGTWFCAYKYSVDTYYVSMSKDGGATWAVIGQDGITWPHEEFLASMYTVAAKPNSVFLVSDGDSPGSNGDMLINEIDIQVAGTINSRNLAKRYYPRASVDDFGQFDFLTSGFNPPAYRNYKGSCYTNNGWVTSDGISFRQIYQANDNNVAGSIAHLMFCPSDTLWWKYHSQIDNNARQNFQVMVPVAGVAIGYNEGASAQFVRIT